MDEASVRHRRIITYFQGIVAGLAVLAFFSQPLMKFAHPGGLCVSGAMIAIGIASTYLNYVLDKVKSPAALFGPGMLVGGMFALVVCTLQAYQVSRTNDDTCAKIELDMLSAHPAIADGPAKFQAFLCRPMRGSIVIR